MHGWIQLWQRYDIFFIIIIKEKLKLNIPGKNILSYEIMILDFDYPYKLPIKLLNFYE
jgi:hypothetical protein